MPKVTAFHRPDTVEAALALLAEPGRVPIGGGTVINTPGGEPVEVVDLSRLDLQYIGEKKKHLRLGATAVLQDVVEHPAAPPLVAEMAKRELPSTLRTLATVGGTIATGDAESLFVAALLAFGCTVELAPEGIVPLSDYLAGSHQGLITGATIETDGTTGFSETGRTPADTPIVAALARRHAAGTTLVLTGVADVPVLVSAEDPLAGLDPADDFRGTSEYRRHLAEVHSRRALDQLG